MKVLAIDPGTNESAVLAWDGKVVLNKEIIPNGHVVNEIPMFKSANTLIAIEMVASYGMPVGKEVFETCVWIGRFIQAAIIPVRLIYRKDVKLHHCMNMRAKDSNVRQTLIDKYGAPGVKAKPGVTYGIKSHLWAAFAIATYVTETANN